MQDSHQSIKPLLGLIEEALISNNQGKEPRKLYEPTEYILSLKAKRIRPLLCLLSAKAYGASAEQVIKPAISLEVFHNFTLLHDDIMDEADLRRGMPTVHKKWDVNTAILSGDAMMIQAYSLLSACRTEALPEALSLFNTTALEVCEGQQMDMDFEERDEVGIPEYTEMIRLKTAVLLAASLKLGALLAGASPAEQDHMYEFGQSLGIAFQIKDDYLDCYGSEEFGKRIGGDILEGKKTYLYNQAWKKASEKQREVLRSKEGLLEDERINRVMEVYADLGIEKESENAMAHWHDKAFSSLQRSSLSNEQRAGLSSLTEMLWNRMT